MIDLDSPYVFRARDSILSRQFFISNVSALGLRYMLFII